MEVSFGANGEVAPGERIVTLEPEESSPCGKEVRILVDKYPGSASQSRCFDSTSRVLQLAVEVWVEMRCRRSLSLLWHWRLRHQA